MKTRLIAAAGIVAAVVAVVVVVALPRLTGSTPTTASRTPSPTVKVTTSPSASPVGVTLTTDEGVSVTMSRSASRFAKASLLYMFKAHTAYGNGKVQTAFKYDEGGIAYGNRAIDIWSAANRAGGNAAQVEKDTDRVILLMKRGWAQLHLAVKSSTWATKTAHAKASDAAFYGAVDVLMRLDTELRAVNA